MRDGIPARQLGNLQLWHLSVTGSSREPTTDTQARSVDISIHLSPAQRGKPDSLGADLVAPTICLHHSLKTTIPPGHISQTGIRTSSYPTTLLRTLTTLLNVPRNRCKLKLASSTESGCSRQDSSVCHLALPVSPSLAVLCSWVLSVFAILVTV